MEVDWAGQAAHLADADSGEDIEAYVFVAVLPYSGYAYTEAFLSQDQEAWTQAHVNAYNYCRFSFCTSKFPALNFELKNMRRKRIPG
jgi:transposase